VILFFFLISLNRKKKKKEINYYPFLLAKKFKDEPYYLNYPNNSIIESPYVGFINITFDKPIDLGDGQLRIYQSHHNTSILRQFFTKDTLTHAIDYHRNTVKLKILKSTFNIPNSNYTIEFEKNFILNKAKKKRLIEAPQKWNLITGK